MTELLERALAEPSKRIAKLKTLSASEQDALAKLAEEDRLNDFGRTSRRSKMGSSICEFSRCSC